MNILQGTFVSRGAIAAALLFFALVAGVASVGHASAAPHRFTQALTPDQALYHCQVAQPHQAHTPPALSPLSRAAPSTQAQKAVCADGRLPQPVARFAAKGIPSPHGREQAPRRTAAGTDYFYADAAQYKTSVGAQGYYSQHAPSLALADFHSLAELAVQSSDGQQIVEIGWTVDRAVNGGDTQPHLFVYHWVDRTGSCYNGCGFVQVSHKITPGMRLSVTSSPQWYAIEHYQGNWWLWYNNEWFGYFPDSLWNGRYTQSGLLQWFGEVAASNTTPCTQMGDGLYGTRNGSAVLQRMQVMLDPKKAETASARSSVTNDHDYNIGHFTGSSFSFGGPGAC